ncbi:Bromodomain-containing protein 8 [Chelonia mydas]|uniref:Bromodomain-containing protein 8 n=1 Tax=Chelonia mydas TaxID=8469 RepID=M7B1K7_CHEMY|nr:Bromodomain-containing protein 8 [Chelonia mydas]
MGALEGGGDPPQHPELSLLPAEHKLLGAGPTEPWSVREKLCLASSVMRSGDQNWVSVSRAIKPFAEPGRPPDWFSQKHCASQYSELLETTETPKRKRGEKGEVVETVEDVIVRKLTAERVEELKKVIKETQEKYRQLKKDAELIQAGHMDSRLEELCNDIVVKKKMEEEEAEVKRKATDAAYQARQAVKNPPRRLTGVMVRSPAGSSSPGRDYALGDLSQQAVDETSPGVTPGTLPSTPVASFIGIPDTPPGSAPLDAPITPVTDDSPQKKILGQKATPPPSPLLSELLKKGSLLPTSPRLVGENEMTVTSGHMNSSGVLLETSAGVLLSLLTFACAAVFVLVKVDDHPEVLDVAAVEAALSFCEETDDPQALTGPWEHPIQQDHEKQAQIPHVTVKQERRDCDEPEAKEIQDLISIGELGSEIKTESAELEQNELDSAGAMQIAETPELRSRETEEQQKAAAVVGENSETETESTKGEAATHSTVKIEIPPDDDSSPPHVLNASDDSSQADVQHKFELSESMKEETRAVFGKDAQGEDDDEDGASEAASLEEPKEEDQGEGYLSEMDNEPPVSESDDGFSIHNAPLQSHTLADSIPSSPASSQFSVCSEDQEAIQAQKIWKKAIMLVWRAAANHRYANVFLQPVTDDIAPGYHSIVQRPMDLSTIKKNIENGLIRTTAEFQRDIMLMFQNAVMYNSSDHDVYHMAVEMQRDVLEQIQQFLATQLIMQTSESGISAKSLRGRDSTRKQDASEKMGRAWLWLESNRESPSDSVKSSGCLSLSSSWDSSLELEVGSWRMTEEAAVEEQEESSQEEEDCRLESREPLVWEDGREEFQEEAGQCEQDSLLQFLLEVTHLMEPLCISVTDSEQNHWAFCGSGQQEEREVLSFKEEMAGPLVPREEERQLQLLIEEAGELHIPGREVREEYPALQALFLLSVCFQGDVLEQPAECAQGESHLLEEDNDLSAHDNSDSYSPSRASLVDSSLMSPASSQLVPLSCANSLRHLLFKKTLLSIWKMIASHRYCGPFLKPVSDKQAPGYKDVVRRPMDLTNIKRRLSKGQIWTTAQFQRDLMLMFQNAVMYNSSDHHVHRMAVEMQRDVLEQLQLLAAKHKQIRRGVKEVQKFVNKGEKGIIVLAGDTLPIEVYCHIPVMCEDRSLPYAYIPSKSDLGAAGGSKRPTCVIMIKPHEEYQEAYKECWEEVVSLPVPL